MLENDFDIGRLSERLRSAGWSSERLVKNDIPVDGGIPGRRYSYADFWRTIARLGQVLPTVGVQPIFIKSVRQYAYADANVDVLVPAPKLRHVSEVLTRNIWETPSRRDMVEQLLIERAKNKLPTSEPGFVAAHLYGGVSWRYQSDIGMLRVDGVSGNPEQLVQTHVGSFISSDMLDEASRATEIWIPTDAAEFVLQAAHISFENFRITVGEAVNFVLLKRRFPSAWAEGKLLARSYGCTAALHLVDQLSDHISGKLEQLNPAEYPITIPYNLLAPVWEERWRFLRAKGSGIQAVAERTSTMSVYALLRTIRTARRVRRGAEDYR